MNIHTKSLLAVLTTATATVSAEFQNHMVSMNNSERASSHRKLIAGGETTLPGDYPYFVYFGRCGGVLIAPDIVLTAAHCDDQTGVQVQVGAWKRNDLSGPATQSRFCEKWIKDPLFGFSPTNWSVDYDFALCKLDEPVTIDTSRVRLELNNDAAVPFPGDPLVAVGLGALNSPIESVGTTENPEIVYQEMEFPTHLQETILSALSDEDCEAIGLELSKNPLPQIEEPNDWRDIKPRQFCTGYPMGDFRGFPNPDFSDLGSTCPGDSGSPIVKRRQQDDGVFVDTLVGITSWGYYCQVLGVPSVKARVSSRLDWIQSTACNDLGSVAPFCNNNNNNNNADNSPAKSCDGPELKIVVATDRNVFNNTFENGWLLVDNEKGVVKNTIYTVGGHVNEHTVCLEYDASYGLYFADLGDGTDYLGRPVDAPPYTMCDQEGYCGFYSVVLDGEIVKMGHGDDFNIIEIGEENDDFGAQFLKGLGIEGKIGTTVVGFSVPSNTNSLESIPHVSMSMQESVPEASLEESGSSSKSGKGLATIALFAASIFSVWF